MVDNSEGIKMVETLEGKVLTESRSEKENESILEKGTEKTNDSPMKNTSDTNTTSATNALLEADSSTTNNSVQAVTNSSAITLPKSKHQETLQKANDEIATLLLSNHITNEKSSHLQSILRENATLHQKISKLKLLLSRSSKANKDTKVDLETHKKLLASSQDDISRLQVRLESMASRPTHMDLLADFETNFDKAVLSLHSNKTKSSLNQQSGGEATTSSFGRAPDGSSLMGGDENVSALLLTELSQAKARVEHLESINAKILSQSSNLEKIHSKQIIDLESGESFQIITSC